MNFNRHKKTIRDSIRHWEIDIVSQLRLGREIEKQGGILEWTDNGQPVPCYSDSCSLCLEVNNDCRKCYFTHYYGKSCTFIAWRDFNRYRNLEAALKMVNALREIMDNDGVSEITVVRKKFGIPNNHFVSILKREDKIYVNVINENMEITTYVDVINENIGIEAKEDL
jgi:hypothetical protein